MRTKASEFSDRLRTVLEDALMSPDTGVRLLIVAAVAALVCGVGLGLLLIVTGLAEAIGPIAGSVIFLAAIAALAVWLVAGWE